MASRSLSIPDAWSSWFYSIVSPHGEVCSCFYKFRNWKKYKKKTASSKSSLEIDTQSCHQNLCQERITGYWLLLTFTQAENNKNRASSTRLEHQNKKWICWNLTFPFVASYISFDPIFSFTSRQCLPYDLVRFQPKNHLVRARKKILLWLKITVLATADTLRMTYDSYKCECICGLSWWLGCFHCNNTVWG